MKKKKDLTLIGQLKREAQRDERKYKEWLKPREHLVDLLNEYEAYRGTTEPTRHCVKGTITCDCMPPVLQTLYGELLCGKEYGFIQRLVENEKIDEDEFAWFLYGDDYISRLDEAIIAWLAIGDNPIDDLISILK